MNQKSKNKNNIFPNYLISPPYYAGQDGRSWSLLSCGVQKAPSWVTGIIKSKRPICIFREIAYLGTNGEVEGLGRSWIPWSRYFFKLLIRSFNFFDPKPIGVAIKTLLIDDYQVEVVRYEELSKVLTPYRLSEDIVSSFQRAVKQTSSNKYIVFTEEDILSAALKR